MEKKYDHKKIEKEIYEMWENGGYFTPDIDPDKKPYTILLPPPNANGILHVGHALMVALEDLLIRWRRMQGYSTLWLPGTDHAGFETQAVFEKHLRKEGKSRMDYDRKTLYNMIRAFVEEQGNVIYDQIRSLGASLDWSRSKFTLDEDVVRTVYSTFEKMVSEGLVYRDNYMVNYCVYCGTTLSDLETEHKEKKAPLYYIRYPLIDRGKNEPKYLVVATTRPESIFVDTHLAVNPEDKDNSWLIGRKLENPLTGISMDVLADTFVDPEFGTGLVKLTPAHDKTDYEVAQKHGLPVITAFGVDGIVQEAYKLGLNGLQVKGARKKAIEILHEKNLIEKIDENYEHNVSVCYKCGTTIEPLVLPNWFVKVASLKEPAHEAVKSGKVKIYPKWQEIKYHRWMEEMRDWPISRQIAWGIRIPVWYDVHENPNLHITFLDKSKQNVTGTIEKLLKSYSLEEISEGLQSLIASNNAKYTVSADKPLGDYLPETDTFDTWFSSGQWPLVTLGYPNSEDFKYFFPTDVLETGWEILRFWVSRMIMFSLYLTGEVPFKDVYLHGLVRAADGRKMSKSLGNQVNPLDYITEYGADALRMGLISGTATGKDFNFPHDKVLAYRNFANKIWNMARFMNIMFEKYREEFQTEVPVFDKETMENSLIDADREILKGLNSLIKSTDRNLSKYRFAQAGEDIYHFMWDELASKYIENVKDREDKDTALSVLRYVYLESLKLLHPFMPFVTEEIWRHLAGKDDTPLIVSLWPRAT